ncbi:MAG: sel1 repeat family protein [Magnetococcales bacterium]|nr:sel1 repeat family protein [Magnetococcales bacterium]
MELKAGALIVAGEVLAGYALSKYFVVLIDRYIVSSKTRLVVKIFLPFLYLLAASMIPFLIGTFNNNLNKKYQSLSIGSENRPKTSPVAAHVTDDGNPPLPPGFRYISPDDPEVAHLFGGGPSAGQGGILPITGRVAPQDAAIDQLRMAAEKGDAEAQYKLGVMFENGDGVSQDYKKSVKWFRLAAEQGFLSAQNNLGFMFLEGRGVIQDYKEAMQWFRLAAERGLSAAQNNIGFMYLSGEGVPKDNIQAHMWLNLAGANGNKTAPDALKAVAMLMTPEQIAKAQELARNFVPVGNKGPIMYPRIDDRGDDFVPNNRQRN